MIDRFIDQWAQFVVKRRVIVLILTILLLIAMVIPMKNLYFDNSNEMWFIKGDPSLADYSFLKDTFGSSQGLLIGVPLRKGEDSVITAENMRTIHEITEFLEGYENVTKVSSLSKSQFQFQFLFLSKPTTECNATARGID